MEKVTLSKIRNQVVGGMGWTPTEFSQTRPAIIWGAIKANCNKQSSQHEFAYSLLSKVVTDLINIQLKKEDRVKNIWPLWAELHEDKPKDLEEIVKQGGLKEFSKIAKQILNGS